MSELYFLGGLAVTVAMFAARGLYRRRDQTAAAGASGLAPVRDLSHLPDALQRTALWALGDGGFERRVLHGVMFRRGEEIDVTAFDLETLREKRGEWAYLPVDKPFRIGGVVSVAVCELARSFPHLLLKRAGGGDELADDSAIERAASLAKALRDRLGVRRSYPAELPPTLPAPALKVELPPQWRAYGTEAAALTQLVNTGFGAVLARAGRRDLVIELIDSLVVVYPAARDVVGADAFADLTSTALALTEGILASAPSLSPRGVESRAPLPSSDSSEAD